MQGCAAAATSKEDSELLPTTKAFYVSAEDNPNMIVFLKMEKILEKMQEEKSGVAIRTVKSFMSKIPSVFTGQDLIAWLVANMDFSDVNEALCLANRMASFGYFFPVDDHVLTVKNDSTYYRFQVRNAKKVQFKALGLSGLSLQLVLSCLLAQDRSNF